MSGNAEIDQPEVSIVVADDVLRLHVAVNDAGVFRVNECLQNVQSQPQELLGLERPVLEHLPNILTQNPPLPQPDALSNRCRDVSLLNYWGYAGGAYLRYSENFPLGGLSVLVRANNL